MNDLPQPLEQLSMLLLELDGRSYQDYQILTGRCFGNSDYRICFVHIQGSPGAFPASVVHLVLAPRFLKLPGDCLANPLRERATADYLVRAFRDAVGQHGCSNRGTQGSGSFQPVELPPQVLETNLVKFGASGTQIAFRISLPGSVDNRALGEQADQMFSVELPDIVLGIQQAVAHTVVLETHCDRVEDMLVLQTNLYRHGLVAFVAEGARLPRQSGVSQLPMGKEARTFQVPEGLAVQVNLPHAGRVRGLGIRQGVSVIIGGGFHGKSTLLDALAMAVYPHIPGDGREQVASHAQTAFVCAEQGRAVSGVDISGFMDQMPGNSDPEKFWTQNASGSTSQAAAIVEAVLAGAKLLLIDEDCSATNFLIRDDQMRRLTPEDPITPLFDRVQELYQTFGVSTLIVAGSSSQYLGVADHVMAMRNFTPLAMTDQVRQLTLPQPVLPAKALTINDARRLAPDNFDPTYRAERLNKAVAVRIKPLRLHETLLEYGNQQLDLTPLRALVNAHQVLAIGYALLLARNRFKDAGLSPTDLAGALNDLMDAKGLEVLCHGVPQPLFLARPRELELAGAINRIRNLKVDFA
jgi:predicted ABC-class ATPase